MNVWICCWYALEKGCLAWGCRAWARAPPPSFPVPSHRPGFRRIRTCPRPGACFPRRRLQVVLQLFYYLTALQVKLYLLALLVKSTYTSKKFGKNMLNTYQNWAFLLKLRGRNKPSSILIPFLCIVQGGRIVLRQSTPKRNQREKVAQLAFFGMSHFTQISLLVTKNFKNCRPYLRAGCSTASDRRRPTTLLPSRVRGVCRCLCDHLLEGFIRCRYIGHGYTLSNWFFIKFRWTNLKQS